MLLKKHDAQFLAKLNNIILNSYDYIEGLEIRVKLIAKHMKKLFEILKNDEYVINELKIVDNLIKHCDMEHDIQLIKIDDTSLDRYFGNQKVPYLKGFELVEKINLIFYYIIANQLEDIKPKIEKSPQMEKIMCIAMLNINIKYLADLGFYGQDIKQAIDYASEYLKLNKLNKNLNNKE